MDIVLVKIFATALALSGVTTQPANLRTHFDAVTDQAEVVRLLQAGCQQMRDTFGIEGLDLDDLIETAFDDPDTAMQGVGVLKGIRFSDLHASYRQICKNEPNVSPTTDWSQVITFYNNALADLPDHTRLKTANLPGATTVLDAKDRRFAEIFEPDNRRIWVDLKDIPPHVQQAFIAAEDKRFRQHKGIDERGLIRAFIGNLGQSGRAQGGSTITQQVVKNLLVGEDVTYERKIREMVIASRLEQTLSKDEILALYLNSIYLGRSSWGVEMAAKSYFGKHVSELTLAEGALLAGLPKGPNYYNPDRYPERARERLDYVLSRMQEDNYISAAAAQNSGAAIPKIAAFESPRRDSGFYFLDQVTREAKAQAGVTALTSSSYVVHSTVNPELQRSVEAALQEGLAQYETNMGRAHFAGSEANLTAAVKRAAAQRKTSYPVWQEALLGARVPLYDVHWIPALVMGGAESKKGEPFKVGLPDGRTLPLKAPGEALRILQPYDLIFVQFDEQAKSPRAELRIRPAVQGAALVIENQTGRILAMAGGFSFALSQFNRAIQAERQPGSALKPLTFLTALQAGLQPNTLVRDESITLPPIGHPKHPNPEDYWTPKNYDSKSWGIITLRRALENSKNQVTARLLKGGIDDDPEKSLDRICNVAKEIQIYRDCVRFYPFVLGAQPVRMINLAAFYATIANEGRRPAPYAVESIEQAGRTIYQHPSTATNWIGSADRASFFQLKTMLQGVLLRGTARRIKELAPYVAGKTGTSEDENDAWFVGFSNDVTVAVWVGYDNADGKRRTLGDGQTGSQVAIPIFQTIIQAAWATQAPKTALNPPSPEARRQLVAAPIDLESGDRLTGRNRNAFTEYFKTADGKVPNTQHQLVRERSEPVRSRLPRFVVDSMTGEVIDPRAPPARETLGQGPVRILPQPYAARGFLGSRAIEDDEGMLTQRRRIDPDYFFRPGTIN